MLLKTLHEHTAVSWSNTNPSWGLVLLLAMGPTKSLLWRILPGQCIDKLMADTDKDNDKDKTDNNNVVETEWC